MAGIFLSYAREDFDSAQALAAALKRAGHSVWWDSHIRGGAQYAPEIEAALAKADVVVVLWSKSSVGSAWVRDEAAAARDSARLIPVTLDGTPPPMGFRQYQAIDMAGWKGRGRPVHFAQLLEAIAGSTGTTAAGAKQSASDGPASSSPARSLYRKWQAVAAVLAVAFVAAALVFLLLRGGHDRATAPTVAVVAAAAGDPQKSKELAQLLTSDLSRLRGDRAGSFAVLGAGDRASAKADYIVQVHAYSDPGTSRADLSLNQRRTSQILWSGTFDRPTNRAADLRQQAAVELAAVLSCMVKANSSKGGALDTETLKVHLDGCARMSDLPDGTMDPEAATLYRSITETAPNFALGWANLARIEANAIPGATPAERHALWPAALDHVARARKLDPTLGEIYVAEAGLTLPAEWGKKISLYDRGLIVDPGHPQLLRYRAETLMNVGRVNEAVNDARQAFERDPLSPSVRDSYITWLAHAGRTQAALKELQEAERIWPGATSVRSARARFDLRYGDPSNALRLLRERGSGDLNPVSSDTSWEAFLTARKDASPKNVEAAISAFMARYRSDRADVVGLVQALGHFGRIDQAYEIMESAEAVDGISGATEVLFRPYMRGFRSDPRFMRLAHRLKLLDYWRQNQLWPDFCRDAALTYNCEKEAEKNSPGRV